MRTTMSAIPTFPAATILGYPRIGPRRELKRALESLWAGRSTEAELTTAAAELRRTTRSRLGELGLGAEAADPVRSEEHTSELQSRGHLVCRLLLEKKKRTPSHTRQYMTHEILLVCNNTIVRCKA